MALVFHFSGPEAENWVFQLLNIFQKNLDTYEQAQGYIEKRRAVLEPDGSAYIVIAAHNPSIGGNWINSFGHRHGTMSLRFIKCAKLREVDAYLMSLADLRARGRQLLGVVAPVRHGPLVD